MLEHYIMKLLFMKQKTKTDLCVDIGVSRQTYYNLDPWNPHPDIRICNENRGIVIG